MIEIQNPNVWKRAFEKLLTERQSIRRHEPGLWLVTNLTKNNGYAVRVERKDGKTFITCGCEAGSPTTSRRIPMPCKHAGAVILFLRAIRGMRRHALTH
jgi:hypothetical protein